MFLRQQSKSINKKNVKKSSVHCARLLRLAPACGFSCILTVPQNALSIFQNALFDICSPVFVLTFARKYEYLTLFHIIHSRRVVIKPDAQATCFCKDTMRCNCTVPSHNSPQPESLGSIVYGTAANWKHPVQAWLRVPGILQQFPEC